MKCPKCDEECRKGSVQCRNAESLAQLMTTVTWYPEDKKGKIIRKSAVDLTIDAEAYYCDTCMKVYAIYEEK